MYKNHRITICLPCRNEANHLPEIVARIPSMVDEIIIISNASTDSTFETAARMGGRVKALRDDRVKNGIGYGYAHMSGIAVATGDLIATADGDGTYPINKLPEVIDFLDKNNLDFVSCNRYPLQPGTKIPFFLQMGVRALNLEVLILYQKKIKDILSGMWVMRRSIKDNLKLTEGDWNLSPQIKLNAALHPKIRFGEYPIIQNQRMGQSKQKYLKTGFQHLWWILQNRLRYTR